MKASGRFWRLLSMSAGGGLVLVAVFMGVATALRPAQAAGLFSHWHHCDNCSDSLSYCSGPGDICDADEGGVWYWMRSPEQERRVVMNIFNRYCIRCHGVDGRGVWDIPDVPDFTDVRWQVSRPDVYRARVIMEGRGAVMPSFRGTLTLEEAWAMARYLHTFVPGTEVSRPDLSTPAPAPAAAPAAPPAVAPAPVATPEAGTPAPIPR